MKSATKFKLNSLTSVISASLLFSAYTVNAEQEKQVERIEITGSHIKRTDLEGPSPVTSLSADDIAKTGVTDLIGLFAKLPISGQGTFSTQANSSDDTANGGSSVSLRGLGADSTLILVNGRRVSVSPFAKGIDTAFVDINNIPIAAIKRVDILKDGASATYGSDAIAGVINVILRDDIDGVEVSAKYGDTADGGGEETNVSVVFGNTTDNSSHTFILDYFNREEVLYADRNYSATANQRARTGDVYATDFRSSSGIPGTIALKSDPTNRMPDTFGNDVCAPEDIIGNLCGYDYAPYMTMFPQNERFSFNYSGRYDVNDTFRVFTELNGQNSKTMIRGAGSPSFNELFMDGDNINHPFANMPDHEFHGQDLTMRRRMVDIGNREKRVDADYYRAILGFEGEWGDWGYEIAYSYIKSQSVERGVDGFPNKVRLQEAIDSGAYDPFEPSSNGQQVLDYIETTTTRIGKSTNKTFDFKVNGPLAELPAGELMLAVGAEYREESISDNPDDQYLRGQIFGTEATQANGTRDNSSLFAEVAVPVIDDLEVQLAVRYEDYSDFGDTTNPKLSFSWRAIDNLLVRGSWGTAFRAPSLHQLGLGRTDESPTLVDKYRCDLVGLGCDPFEYTAVFEGNPDLGPEESESYNLGVVYNITDDLSVSVDYYSYDIEDIIDSDTQFIFTTQGGNPDVVERIPTGIANDPGEVVTIYDTFQNIGDLTTSGLDVDVKYNLPTEIGDFKFSYVMNYMLEYEDKRPDGNGGQRIDTEAGDFEQPELRFTLSADYAINDFTTSLALNFVDSFKQDDSVRVQTARDAQGNKIENQTVTLSDVDEFITVDATFNYHGIENTTLTLGITNLFNEEPPFTYDEFMGFATNVHSGQGRFMYLQANYKF